MQRSPWWGMQLVTAYFLNNTINCQTKSSLRIFAPDTHRLIHSYCG